MPDLKDTIERLIAEAKARGGIVYSETRRFQVPIRPGEQLALVRLGANGQGEALLPPLPLAHGIGFGDHIVGVYIIRAEEANSYKVAEAEIAPRND